MKTTENGSSEEPLSGGFVPRVTLDLDKATTIQFAAVVEALDQYRQSLGEISPIGLANGWHDITPQVAEQCLLRNVKGANRKATLATVRYYGYTMQLGDWKKTGQSIIFTKDDILQDGQNRCWAGLLTGKTFTSYVVSDVEPELALFAFIDNGKPRSPSTALETAGLDGRAALTYAVARLEQNIRVGCYSMQKVSRALRMTPIQALRIVQGNPQIHDAVYLAVSEYRDVVDLIGKELTAYTTYKVITVGGGEIILDEFMRHLVGDESDLPEGSPILALRVWLDRNRKAEKPLPKHIVLAHVIKAFNAWKAGETVKRLKVTVDESFPEFAEAQQSPE